MELVGWKQPIKKKKEEKKRKDELDFLAGFPAIVPWWFAKSKRVMSSLTDSLVFSECHYSKALIRVWQSAICLSLSCLLTELVDTGWSQVKD